MTIADLFVRLGFKADNAKLKIFSEGLKSVKIGAIAATATVTAMAIGVKKLTDDAFNAAGAFAQFETETGSSAQELQKWQSVAMETNNSAESMTEAFKTLASNREKIKLGGGSIKGYQMLGIDPDQNPEDILENLRTKLDGLAPAMKKNVIADMGLSSELLQVLELSNNEFDKMAGRAFIIDKSAIATMNEARSSIQAVGMAVNWIKSMIAAELAPAIIKLNKELTKWIRNNKKGILNGIKETVKWINLFGIAILNSVKMIDAIIRGTIGWKNGFIALIGVIALLNSALIFSPIGAIVAGIALLVLVLDDLQGYFSGDRESLFGNIMKMFPEFEAKFLGFVDAVKDSFSLIKSLFSGDESGIDEFTDKLGGLGSGIVAVFKLIQTAFQWLWMTIKLTLRPIQFLIDALGVLWDAFTGEVGWSETIGKIQEAFSQRAGDFTGDIVEFGKAAGENIKTVANAFNINIEVETTADANETANLVAEKLQSQALQEQLNQAAFQRAGDE